MAQGLEGRKDLFIYILIKRKGLPTEFVTGHDDLQPGINQSLLIFLFSQFVEMEADQAPKEECRVVGFFPFVFGIEKTSQSELITSCFPQIGLELSKLIFPSGAL